MPEEETPSRYHFAHPTETVPLCIVLGTIISQPGPCASTRDRSEVTCKECLSALDRQEVETRVRYVYNNVPYLPGFTLTIYTHTDDGWIAGTPDGAAAYPWLMNNCIVWVEERVVYKPEEWTVV